MNESESSRSVVVERLFPHPPEKLWRALTQAPLIAQWLMRNDFEATVGKKFTLRADPVPNWSGVIDCEVLVVVPQKELAYTWGSAGLESVVKFTVTPAEGGTILRMEQTGFKPDQEANYRGAMYGWQKFFAGLEGVLQRGEA